MYIRATATGNAAVLGVQETHSQTFDLRDLPDDCDAAHDLTVAEDATELLLEGIEGLQMYAHGTFLENLTVPHYVAGFTTYVFERDAAPLVMT